MPPLLVMKYMRQKSQLPTYPQGITLLLAFFSFFQSLFVSLFSAWDWDTPKSMCDIIEDDIYM